MKNCDAFAGFHPICSFLYFGIITGITMFVFHPAVLLISLAGGTLYHRKLKGHRAVLFALLYALPLLLFTALINPVFNHEGSTVLLWLPSGNPLTMEACVYGALSGVMIMAVITWFACYNEVMSSDKFIYLFGRLIPVLSLLISMALRFVPLYYKKLEEIRVARAGLEKDVTQGKLTRKLKNGVAMLSVLLSWVLEDSIETADSMKARGYGLKGRTACSVYTFGRRDRLMTAWLVSGLCIFLMGTMAGLFAWNCYPYLHGAKWNGFTVCFLLLYLMLVLTPVLTDRLEEALYQKGIEKVYDRA